MATSTVNVTYRDVHGGKGIFGFLIDAAYDDGTWAELLAFLQDCLDASYCAIDRVTITKDVDIATLTNNDPAEGGMADRVNDQAILSFRAESGLVTKLSLPAPMPDVFLASGPTAGQDVDLADPLVTALVATGITVPLLAVKTEDVLTLVKGWRKGQPHS